MKKIYYLAGILSLSSAATAQSVFPPVQRAMTASFVNQSHPNESHDRAPGDVILTYEDDFSVPGNWVVANTSAPAMNFAINTVGPTSAPALIASTSGGNFAWYDCDPQGNGSTVDATLTYGTAFDLTGYPGVMVSFEQFYMDYYEDVFVEISTNGLAGPWTSYEVNADYLPNAASPVNPVQTLVNISALAGGQANVGVRFHYIGGWGWSWQIDDFALVEAYQNDLSILDPRFSSGSEMNEYYLIPTSQITEITFGGLIKSSGVTTQTNTYMHVLVDGGTTYDEVSSQLLNLSENMTDTFSIETPNGWTPAAGTYDLEIIAVTDDYTDQLTADNTATHEPITVGGVVYARDNGIISGGFSGFSTTAGDPLEIGNTFEIFSPTTIGKVQIGLTSSGDSEGQSIYGAVYIWDAGLGDFTLLVQTDDYVVQAADLGAIVELSLQSDVDALAGEIYLITAGHYGGSPTVSFAEAQPTHEYSVYAIHSSGTITAGTPQALIVRAVFGPTDIGLDEQISATGFTAYPNPSNNQFTVQYNLTNGGNTSLTIADLTGKVVLSNDFGTQVEGSYKTVISTDDLSSGVYFYTLTVDGVSTTKKLTISKN